MQLPESIGLLLLSSLQVWHLNIFLLSHTIDILMEVVEELS